MPTNTTAYDIGDQVRLGLVVTTTSGRKTDTGVTLYVRTPDTPYSTGYVTKYGPVTASSSITRDSTGTWHKIVTVTHAGRWTYQWRSTGSILLSTGGAFAVRPRFASTNTTSYF